MMFINQLKKILPTLLTLIGASASASDFNTVPFYRNKFSITDHLLIAKIIKTNSEVIYHVKVRENQLWDCEITNHEEQTKIELDCFDDIIGQLELQMGPNKPWNIY